MTYCSLFRYSTAAPSKGAVNSRRAALLTLSAVTVLFVSGLNHSTFIAPFAADRSTVTGPPAGRYTRYSRPRSARQNFVEAISVEGVIAARFIRRANRRVCPIAVREAM